MAYRRKIPMKRKVVIKTRKRKAAPAMVQLIKSVTRRTQETKTGGVYATGISLFHNQTSYINNFYARFKVFKLLRTLVILI